MKNISSYCVATALIFSFLFTQPLLAAVGNVSSSGETNIRSWLINSNAVRLNCITLAKLYAESTGTPPDYVAMLASCTVGPKDFIALRKQYAKAGNDEFAKRRVTQLIEDNVSGWRVPTAETGAFMVIPFRLGQYDFERKGFAPYHVPLPEIGFHITRICPGKVAGNSASRWERRLICVTPQAWVGNEGAFAFLQVPDMALAERLRQAELTHQIGTVVLGSIPEFRFKDNSKYDLEIFDFVGPTIDFIPKRMAFYDKKTGEIIAEFVTNVTPEQMAQAKPALQNDKPSDNAKVRPAKPRKAKPPTIRKGFVSPYDMDL